MNDATTEDMADAWGDEWGLDDRVGLGPAPTVALDDARSPLAPRQAAVVAAIHGLASARGIPPTFREVADAMGMRSQNAVRNHVAAIASKRYLRRPRKALSRDLVLLPSRVAAKDSE